MIFLLSIWRLPNKPYLSTGTADLSFLVRKSRKHSSQKILFFLQICGSVCIYMCVFPTPRVQGRSVFLFFVFLTKRPICFQANRSRLDEARTCLSQETVTNGPDQLFGRVICFTRGGRSTYIQSRPLVEICIFIIPAPVDFISISIF